MRYKLFKTKTLKEFDNPLCKGIYVLDLIHGTTLLLHKFPDIDHKLKNMIDDYFNISLASGYEYKTRPSVFTYKAFKFKLDPLDEEFYLYIGVADIKTHRE